jgi:hypothetical protein
VAAALAGETVVLEVSGPQVVMGEVGEAAMAVAGLGWTALALWATESVVMGEAAMGVVVREVEIATVVAMAASAV